MIFDCFPFYNELELLEIRLEELKDIVDWFVLVEADETFSGRPKPFVYEAHREHFAAYNICHIKIHGFPQLPSPWHREAHTRNSLSQGLEKLQAGAEDIVMLSDVDEIPRADLVKEYGQAVSEGRGFCYVFQQTLYYYYVNCRSDKKWHGTRMIRYGDVPSLHELRTMIGKIVPEGGWHFRYLGGIRRIQEQIAASIHLEKNTPDFNAPIHIAHCIRTLTVLGEEDNKLQAVSPDERLPAYLLNNLRRFHHLILHGPATFPSPNVRASAGFVFPEASFSPHRVDVNPEALQFPTRDNGVTEEEYLNLLTALVGVFKPTHLLETGNWQGDGTLALLQGAGPGAQVWSFNTNPIPDNTLQRLQKAASESGNQFHFIPIDTQTLIENHGAMQWRDITQGKATFAFLDTTIPQRASEFAYISDPANGVLDFTRPICVCIHDMSRYRHPHDADTYFLAQTLRNIEVLCQARGWGRLRLYQSRGLYILTKYPENAGIDGQSFP